MSQFFTPLFGGELYETAARFSSDMDAGLNKAETFSDYVRLVEEWWSKAGELGWSSVLVPQAQNGIGSEPQDLASLIEGGGTNALRLPLIPACWSAPQMLLDADCDYARACLRDIVEGSLHPLPITLVATPGALMLVNNGVKISRHGTDLILSGVATGVECVPDASHYLLEAVADDGLHTLLLLETGSPLAKQTQHMRLDGRLSVDVSFDELKITEEMIVSNQMTQATAQRRHLVAATLKCIEAVGAMGRVISETVNYLRSRKQFGVELASFQALRHQVAEIYTAYQNVHALMGHAARQAFLGDGGAHREILLARMRTGLVAREVAKTVIQLHGGMGMTEELFATRLNKLLLMVDFEYGGRFDKAHHTALPA